MNLFQVLRQTADTLDLRARYGGCADDAKDKSDLINTHALNFARGMHHSEVSHAERVARIELTSGKQRRHLGR
jgi:hypothetical protein